jgi:hypothetical protein
VIQASGLDTVIGPRTIFRACKRAGVEPLSMSTADLSRALPSIHTTLRFFLSDEEYRRSVAALSLLVRPAAAS